MGVVQHQRALFAAEQIVASREHEPVRLEVKPGFANLLVWKAIYEFDGRYYVDGIRVGIRPSYFPGESVAKLDVSKDFPWLNPSHSKPGISSASGGFRIIGWLSITTMGT